MPNFRRKSQPDAKQLQHLHPSLRSFAVPIATLSPDPDNARYHSTRNIRAIVSSLETYGQRLPLIANKAGVVKVGNGRLEAMQQLGWTHAAVLFVEDARLHAYAIADNRTGELAGWDYPKLLESIRRDAGTGQLIGYIPSEIREIEKQAAALAAKALADAGQAKPPAVVRCPKCGHEYEETHDSPEEEADRR